MKFNVAINAVQAGQKSATINAEPQLIANSTLGKFQITSAVSKALGIAVGEKVKFYNDIEGLEALANNPTQDVLTFCEEEGINIQTAEGKRQFVTKCTTWFISKGYQQFDNKGNPLMESLRCTAEDKKAAIEAHGAEMIQDEAFRAVLIERVGDENASDEELIAAIDVDDVESPKVESFAGSRTATTGSSTGVGCLLTFGDTAIWTALKHDLGENKTKKNRIFRVLTDKPEAVTVNNGYKNITIDAYPIEFVEDTDPIVRTKAE